jgi:hypothetical protein
MNFVNLTKHPVKVGGKLVPPSGDVARVVLERKLMGKLDNAEVPVYKLGRLSEGAIVGIPDPENETIYIVSAMVRIALTEQGIERSDVQSSYNVAGLCALAT